jgi:adenosylcobinamide kinase / adenosylcobinamide-phosphate guanylyltransferase
VRVRVRVDGAPAWVCHARAVITLVLGGTRSGKSELAERIATSWGQPVTYVATGRATDDDMAARIAGHRARRPAGWSTVEAGADLPAVLASVDGPALVDSLGTWVAACPDLVPDTPALCAVLASRSGDTVIVSEEVGLGVHPMTEAGRHFADALGTLNQAVAATADHVLLAVAGRALPLTPWAP